MKKPIKQAVGDFLAGRGFYIVLLLCVAAIGVSGWYLMREIVLPPEQVAVGGPAAVTVAPSPKPTIPPAVSFAPAPIPSATPKPTPIPVPATPAPKPAATPTAALWGSQIYTWPVKGQVIGDFSLEVLAYDETLGDWRVHEGLDIAAEAGVSVKCVNAGEVTAVYEDDLMGTVVEMSHKEGLTSRYANLAPTPPVKVGDKLDTGAVLGMVGQSAIAEISKPSHLHFEMCKNGENVDPILYLPAQ